MARCLSWARTSKRREKGGKLWGTEMVRELLALMLAIASNEGEGGNNGLTIRTALLGKAYCAMCRGAAGVEEGG